MRNRLVALCATVLSITGVIVFGSGSTAVAATNDDHVTTGGFVPQAIDWQPCPQDPADPVMSCGTLTLPIDWSKPHGATFSLALAKRAADDQANKIGPLLINPGGPGGSGVDFALFDSSYFSPAILAKFDLIGFDPRGVGLSSPIQCSTALLEAMPFPVPATQADYNTLTAYNANLAADCRAHSGPLFDHVDTLSVIRDMDAIRAALGVHQLSYYGVSYGTLIGQEYAEQFPDRFRALVIDSNMDHSLGTTAFQLTEAATDEDSFEQFVDWCDRDATCVLHGQDVNALFDNLMRRAEAGTLTIPGTTQQVSWFLLIELAGSAAYGPSWSQEAVLFSELNAEPVGATAATTAAATPQLTSYPIPIFCEDWNLPVSGYPQLRRLIAESTAVAPHLRVSPVGWGAWSACLNFTVPKNNPQHRLNVRSDVPLLEINSVHDPATAYAWAVDDAIQLGPHARFVTYLGWGHGAYRHSDCTIGTVDQYLLNVTLPPVGKTCPAVPPPDQPAASAQAMARATVSALTGPGASTLGW